MHSREPAPRIKQFKAHRQSGPRDNPHYYILQQFFFKVILNQQGCRSQQDKQEIFPEKPS